MIDPRIEPLATDFWNLTKDRHYLPRLGLHTCRCLARAALAHLDAQGEPERDEDCWINDEAKVVAAICVATGCPHPTVRQTAEMQLALRPLRERHWRVLVELAELRQRALAAEARVEAVQQALGSSAIVEGRDAKKET